MDPKDFQKSPSVQCMKTLEGFWAIVPNPLLMNPTTSGDDFLAIYNQRATFKIRHHTSRILKMN
jgi:hypothetical protein